MSLNQIIFKKNIVLILENFWMSGNLNLILFRNSKTMF